MAGINDRRHNDDRVMCLRIFADASGETHMEEFEIAFQPRKLFEDDVAPNFYPVAIGVWSSVMPCWAVVAAIRGAEPSVERSAADRRAAA